MFIVNWFQGSTKGKQGFKGKIWGTYEKDDKGGNSYKYGPHKQIQNGQYRKRIYEL